MGGRVQKRHHQQKIHQSLEPASEQEPGAAQCRRATLQAIDTVSKLPGFLTLLAAIRVCVPRSQALAHVSGRVGVGRILPEKQESYGVEESSSTPLSDLIV